MKSTDRNYLRLQFSDKIYRKDGNEFQHFFENIMEKAYPDFQKIKPYGNQGDGGNDGYIKSIGTYYQVYAPDTPAIKEANAAKKLSDDFEKLYKHWSEVSEIKKYCFVYNDKYTGSTQKLELAITKLKKAKPNIEFSIIASKKLEEIFFKLTDTDIQELGFTIDSRIAIAQAYEYIKRIEIALDKEYGTYALKLFNEMNDVIKSLEEEQLQFEWELLEARCLHKNERIEETKTLYRSLSIRYPDDPRPLLYLSEILLDENDQIGSQSLLDKVIDKSHWSYKIHELVRKIKLNEDIDIVSIDENSFPADSKIKSTLYRLYSIFYDKYEESSKAKRFIEKAIYYNPNRFSNYEVKLFLMEKKLLNSYTNNSNTIEDSNQCIAEISTIENIFNFEELNERSKASLNIRKMNIYRLQEDFVSFEKLNEETYQFIFGCYFNKDIDHKLFLLMTGVILSEDIFLKLQDYLASVNKIMTEQLCQSLLVQFAFHDSQLNKAKVFFSKHKNSKYLGIIESIINNDYSSISSTLEANPFFRVELVNCLKGFPDIRKTIIDNIPDDGFQTKNKLLFQHYLDLNDINQAFDILKVINISDLNYLECKKILKVAQSKKAWDFEKLILTKLLEFEKDEAVRIDLSSLLLQTNFNLKDFSEVIRIGHGLLEKLRNTPLISPSNKEAILAQTIQAHLNHNEENYALQVMLKFSSYALSSEFKINIESEVYLRNNMGENALTSIVNAVKMRKRLSKEEYASLFYVFIQIENLIEFNLNSLKEVSDNCFVKLNEQEQWYYIGSDNELDATRIDLNNNLYNIFIGKHLYDEIELPNKYISQKKISKIETVLSIEKYLLSNTIKYFNQLSGEARLHGVQMIEAPPMNETIDTQYLESFLKDLQQPKNPLFDLYCQSNVPLAVLALNEGGLPYALSRIVQENKGFVRINTGTLEEMERQKRNAFDIITNNLPFIIDGSSALFLSESGLLEKFNQFIPNMKVPQSVIAMLLELGNKMRITPGVEATLGFAQGRIVYSEINKKIREETINNIYKSISILESDPNNRLYLSKASKIESLSESRMLPEMCDACIFAQKLKIPLLSDDFYYPQLNVEETNKTAPVIFSSFSLARVMYEQNFLNFIDYLKYFAYLSSYRARFLSFNSDDIYRSIFSEDMVLTIQPENIKFFNFPLTLSQEYGVSFESIFRVISVFLLKIIMDDSIVIKTVELIFIELINWLPKEYFNKGFALLLVQVSENVLNKNRQIILSNTVQDKFNKLYSIINIFNFESRHILL